MTLMGQSENSSVQINIDVFLDGKQLHRVTKTKVLGVIDENLSWKNHIDGISKTISRNIGVINKVNILCLKDSHH